MKFNILGRSWIFKELKTIWQNVKYNPPKTDSKMTFISHFFPTLNEHLGLNQSFRGFLGDWIDDWVFWVSGFRSENLIPLRFYLQMLNNKMLKPNNETYLKRKHQLKQITINRENIVATEKMRILWKMGLKFWDPKFNLLCKIAFFDKTRERFGVKRSIRPFLNK